MFTVYVSFMLLSHWHYYIPQDILYHSNWKQSFYKPSMFLLITGSIGLKSHNMNYLIILILACSSLIQTLRATSQNTKHGKL